MTTHFYKNDQLQDGGAGVNTNVLEYDDSDGRLAMMSGNLGRYIYLSARDKRELAFKLLEEQYDITYPAPYSEGPTLLDRKTPPRPAPEVGQYYRFLSEPGMFANFQGNPIVRVVKVKSAGFIRIRTPDGEESDFHWPAPRLSGPIPPDGVLADIYGELES